MISQTSTARHYSYHVLGINSSSCLHPFWCSVSSTCGLIYGIQIFPVDLRVIDQEIIFLLLVYLIPNIFVSYFASAVIYFMLVFSLGFYHVMLIVGKHVFVSSLIFNFFLFIHFASIRRRALDLLYGMCDVSNAKDIVEELLQVHNISSAASPSCLKISCWYF